MTGIPPMRPFNFQLPIDIAMDTGKSVVHKASPSDVCALDDLQLVLYNKMTCDPEILTSMDTSAPGIQRRIYLCVIFLKIGEIDTLKEHYEADVLIKSRWREPSLDKQKGAAVDWSQVWNPKLFIENTIGDPKESVFQMAVYNQAGEAYVIEKRRIKGTFLENLELMDFPFDVQDLTVTIMSDRTALEIELLDDPDDMHRVNKQSFVDEQEWKLYKFTETEIRSVANEYSDPSIRKLAFAVKCEAARRPAYFFWNIFLITFLICTLAFVTFAVDREKPQNRLQLSFTLVLTSVAFKFVVNQSLPKISYLTYLDKYVLSAMILLILVCSWHGLTRAFSINQDTDKKIDTGVLCFMSGSYVLFNIIFSLRIYLGPGRKRAMLKRKEREYLERLKQHLLRKQERQGGYQSNGSSHNATSI